MADDPLYGDRPKPPLVPMNNAEVIYFDVIRGLDGASPRRRGLVVAGVAIVLLLIPLLTTFFGGSPTVTHVHSPRQLLRELCSELRSAETAFTGGSMTRHALGQRLATIAASTFTPELDSAAADQLLLDVGDQQARLAEDGYIGGTSLDDAHHICSA